jgi:ATP-dependent exoDNAse (exonuclease V) beta subunit
VAFALSADEVERRKRRLRILSYDDLLGRLAEALQRRPRSGAAAHAALEDRAGR